MKTGWILTNDKMNDPYGQTYSSAEYKRAREWEINLSQVPLKDLKRLTNHFGIITLRPVKRSGREELLNALSLHFCQYTKKRWNKIIKISDSL